MHQSHATLSPATSPKVRRRTSARRPPHPTAHSHESHDAPLNAIRSFLKSHTCYDALPISYRLIVLDTKLNVKKALQCLLLNGETQLSLFATIPHIWFQVSCPLLFGIASNRVFQG